jgi:hypothetical protein
MTYELSLILGRFICINLTQGFKNSIFKGLKMASKFGFIAKLEFLQDWASSFIAGINPAITHNLEKNHALKKAHYLSAI